MKTKFILAFVMILSMTFLVSAEFMTYDTDKNNLTMEYDSNNRIISEQSGSFVVNYTYDEDLNGTLTRVSNNDVIVSYEYDNRKRVTKETVEIDGISFERDVSYDSMDRVVSSEVEDEIIYSYDDGGLIDSINDLVNITYNENGQVTERSYLNALVSSLTYDTDNFRLLNILTSTKQDLTYDYDSVGNVIQIDDDVTSDSFVMSYDNLNRLTSTNISGTTFISFVYNPLGNLMEVIFDGTSTYYAYDDLVHAPSQIGETIIPLPEDTHFFEHKNASGYVVAWFGDDGNIALKGKCFPSGNCDSPGDDSLIFRNSIGQNAAFINSTGDLCVASDECIDFSASCNPGRDAFIIQNSSGYNVSYVDFDGNLCLTGMLYENYL